MKRPVLVGFVVLLLAGSTSAGAQDTLPLIGATQRGDAVEVKRLLRQGVDVDSQDSRGATALAHAAFADLADLVQLLMKAGADPHMQDRRSRSPWLWAAYRGSDLALEAFLQESVEVNTATTDGVTALMVAALQGHESTVRILLAAGAQPEVRDRSGADAAAWARDRGHTRVAALIENWTSLPDKQQPPADRPAPGIEGYLTATEREVIAELNRVRTDPRGYAEEVIRPVIALFDGSVLKFPGEIPVRTEEGADAVRECYRVLSSTPAVGPLTARQGLSLAAKDLASDQGPGGAVGHTGSDGSQPRDRVERHESDRLSTWGENVAYGWKNPRRIVFALLVDDGVPDRGHRENIMNPRYESVGVAVGEHSRYGWVCVMDFATFH